MKTTTTNAGLKIKATIKAGGILPNHTRSALKVRSAIKTGGILPNHTRSGLVVKTAVKAGYNCMKNHSARLLVVA